MTTPFGSSHIEGQSTQRPPFFNGSDYSYWKARMRIFIQAQDYEMWSIVVNGPYIPSIYVDGVKVPKLEMDWDEHDMRKAQLNSKAMNVFYCALDRNEFNIVSTCNSAKEIWDRLEVTCCPEMVTQEGGELGVLKTFCLIKNKTHKYMN